MKIKIALLVILFLQKICIYAQEPDSSTIQKQIDSLVNQGRKQLSQRKLDSAFHTLNLATGICHARYGVESYCNALILFNKARVFHANGDVVSADSLYKTAAEIFKLSKSTNTIAFTDCLNNLALRSFELGNFEVAEKYYLQIKEILEQLIGKNQPAYAKLLVGLGMFYLQTGRFSEVEPLLVESIRIYETSKGKLSKETINAMNNLGGYYLSMDDLDKAESTYLEVRDLREKLSGKTDPDFALVYSNLGRIYQKRCDYNKAREYLFTCRNLLIENGFEKSEFFSKIMNNIGSLYLDLSDYRNAEAAYLISKEIRLELFGRNNINYANILNNLGNLYLKLNNLTKAEAAYLEALEIRTRLLGKSHPDVLESYINLGGFYQSANNYNRSQAFFEQALELTAGLYGKTHSIYGINLLNLSGIFLSLHKFKEAESTCKEAQYIIEKANGRNHPDYATCIHQLADIYASEMKYNFSTQLYHEAESIRATTLGKTHPDYVKSLTSLAMDYSDQGEYSKAESYFAERSNISNQILASSLGFLSENELKNYIISFIEQQEQLLYYTYTIDIHNPSFRNICYDNDLIYREFLLHAKSSRIRSAKSDSSLVEKVEDLITLKRVLAREYVKPVSKQINVVQLEEQANALEKEIANKTEVFANLTFTVKEIKKNLKDDEAAINFVRFATPERKYKDSILYAAFILSNRERDPHFVFLFEEKQLKKLLEMEYQNGSNQAFMYSSVRPEFRGGELLDQPGHLGSAIYDLIWRPLDRYLKNITTIYFSPIGLLNRISFHSLPVNGKKLLVDCYDLHQMGSTKSIINKSDKAFTRIRQVALFGGADYDYQMRNITDTLFDLQNEELNWSYADTRGPNENSGFQYLPGTEKEVKSLDLMFTKQSVSSILFTGKDASEENLKRLGSDTCHNPEVLHIASHGFYFPKPNSISVIDSTLQNEFIWSNQPLLRSGTVLSGANEAWVGRKIAPENEDGIVTAYEISNLNLMHTRLVVLSACETALGDIEGVEGVYGLQRAFKMAGVKYMLLSLWKVPDAESVEFMEIFYKQLLSRKEIHKAFRVAQNKIRKKYKDVSKWGAWVLLE